MCLYIQILYENHTPYFNQDTKKQKTIQYTEHFKQYKLIKYLR